MAKALSLIVLLGSLVASSASASCLKSYSNNKVLLGACSTGCALVAIPRDSELSNDPYSDAISSCSEIYASSINELKACQDGVSSCYAVIR